MSGVFETNVLPTCGLCAPLRCDGSCEAPKAAVFPADIVRIVGMLRGPLIAFVEQMELKLRKNDHKDAWRSLPVEALFRQFLLEIEEFKVADEFLTVDAARKELVDIANFALILWDRLGMLEQDRTRRK